MAKITTIIDIGSNSMRMVVLKKTSRYGFHLLNETKSKVKISEGCYENDGNLQVIPMQRAFANLQSFLKIAKNLKSRKIFCVATSALRDAPNKKDFINKVSKELKLNIKIIDGNKEAYYGGIAALNLIACEHFTTVDIGGGSTEFAFVDNNNIVNTISLNIGTVRIKELYFDKNDFKGAKEYIISQLKKVEQKNLPTIVGLGGTARAISKIILEKDNYPVDILHHFTYDVKNNFKLMEKLVNATSTKELKELGVRKDRFDTIATGTFIFKTILEYFSVQKVITSGVGVREGVYLCDILRSSKDKFPVNFNVSVRSLLDRFVDDQSQSAYLGNNAKKIFNALQPLHNLDLKYRSILVVASKLQQIGNSLNFYKNDDTAFNYILNGLNYGFTHEDKVLIAIVAKFTKRYLPQKEDILIYENLLPNLKTIQWLNFMMTLNISLNSEFSKTKYEYILDGETLNISYEENHFLVQDSIKKIKIPVDLDMEFI